MIFLTMFGLAGCSLPGRETLAAGPVAPSAQNVDAAQAFAGRIALVTIAPGTQDFAAPLRQAVAQALAIKPDAAFQVTAQVAGSGKPDADAARLAALTPLAGAVAQAIAGDGVAVGNVALTAAQGGAADQIAVFVK